MNMIMRDDWISKNCTTGNWKPETTGCKTTGCKIYFEYTNVVLMNKHDWKNTCSLKGRACKEEEIKD